MNKLVLLLFTIPFYFISTANDGLNKIALQIEGKQYTNLEMIVRLYNGDEDSKRITIQGKKDKDNKWTFLYDDDIFNQHTYVTFESINEKQTEIEKIGFDNIIDNDTLFAGGVCFSKGTSEVRIKYYRTETILNSTYFDETTNAQVTRKITIAHYLVDNNSDPTLLSSIEAIGYKYCMFTNREEEQYETQLEKYISMTKRYPNSRYFAWLLSNNVSIFNSKEDIYKLYNCFGLELKKSIFGEKINDFLIASNTVFEFDKFENFALPSSISGTQELIITVPSTYNLIIFSASWCSPCHKQIPLLKDIYEKYRDKINLTYVSMDKERTAENWKSLMLKENIQWRSLMAMNHIDKVSEMYYVRGIPHTVLVHPGGKKLEIIDIRQESNYNKLTELLEN